MIRQCVLTVVVAVSTCSGLVFAQPAPNLRSVSVVAVASTGFPNWGYTNGALVTPQDHRGPELYVVTYDEGYSVTNSPRATFLGMPMRQVRVDRYPTTGPTLGYLRYWYINTPFTSGNFAYETTSINTYRKFGTSIQIR